ncbi:hypothetical protein K3495_g5912 [Podosphaera aphanis]|nr:hypothetical protein K3495_g5912 [Podosphaera aphanis]
MPRKKKESAPTPQWSSILIPLYVYPSPGAWDPLYTAIEAYPNLNFTIIVNPGNGPGNGVIPDANYLREIPRLNSNSNVRTIGYISTSWTKRKLALVLADIDTYAGWCVISAGLGISGIFLDETPTIYCESSMQFLSCLASTIRSESNFGNDPLVRPPPGIKSSVKT